MGHEPLVIVVENFDGEFVETLDLDGFDLSAFHAGIISHRFRAVQFGVTDEESFREFGESLFSPRLDTFQIPASARRGLFVWGELHEQLVIHIRDDVQNPTDIHARGERATIGLNVFVVDFHDVFLVSLRQVYQTI